MLFPIAIGYTGHRCEACGHGHVVEGILALGAGRLVSLGRSARLPVNFTCELLLNCIFHIGTRYLP